MKKGAICTVAILSLVVASITTFTVKETEYACVKRFSKIREIKDEAGLYLQIPFIESTQTLPKTKMLYDLKPSDVLTSDKKALVVDTYLIWKITDPFEFIKTVGHIGEMEKRLDAATYNAVKTSFGKITQAEVVSPIVVNNDDMKEELPVDGRTRLNTEIKESVNNQVKSYGIEVEFVEIKKLDLPTDNEQAVFNRMISERKQMATSFIADGDFEANKIKNDTNKEVNILLSKAKSTAETIRGEAEAEYMRILSSTYNNPEKAEFYKFMKSLETLENSMIGEKTLILSEDSMLTKLFME